MQITYFCAQSHYIFVSGIEHSGEKILRLQIRFGKPDHHHPIGKHRDSTENSYPVLAATMLLCYYATMLEAAPHSHVVLCRLLSTSTAVKRWTDTDGIRRHSSRLDVDKMNNEPIPLHV